MVEAVVYYSLGDETEESTAKTWVEFFAREECKFVKSLTIYAGGKIPAGLPTSIEVLSLSDSEITELCNIEHLSSLRTICLNVSPIEKFCSLPTSLIRIYVQSPFMTEQAMDSLMDLDEVRSGKVVVIDPT
jgi:hypothetical protein